MESSSIVKLGISHVPRTPDLSRLTVKENLMMGTFGTKKYDKEKASQLLQDVYKMFPRLLERRTQLGGTLSGGEQQMLAIGRITFSTQAFDAGRAKPGSGAYGSKGNLRTDPGYSGKGYHGFTD